LALVLMLMVLMMMIGQTLICCSRQQQQHWPHHGHLGGGASGHGSGGAGCGGAQLAVSHDEAPPPTVKAHSGFHMESFDATDTASHMYLISLYFTCICT
jgi:hypothetical protein